LLSESQQEKGESAVKKLLGPSEQPPTEAEIQEIPSPFGLGMLKLPSRPKSSDPTHDFMQRIAQLRASKTAAEFWTNEPTGSLRSLAIDILLIPASSGAVERLFSLLTMHAEGRRVGIKEELLRARTLLTYNSHYID
jgi:hypothetical protein